jgi:hypothetical protein
MLNIAGEPRTGWSHTSGNRRSPLPDALGFWEHFRRLHERAVRKRFSFSRKAYSEND